MHIYTSSALTPAGPQRASHRRSRSKAAVKAGWSPFTIGSLLAVMAERARGSVVYMIYWLHTGKID